MIQQSEITHNTPTQGTFKLFLMVYPAVHCCLVFNVTLSFIPEIQWLDMLHPYQAVVAPMAVCAFMHVRAVICCRLPGDGARASGNEAAMVFNSGSRCGAWLVDYC